MLSLLLLFLSSSAASPVCVDPLSTVQCTTGGGTLDIGSNCGTLYLGGGTVALGNSSSEVRIGGTPLNVLRSRRGKAMNYNGVSVSTSATLIQNFDGDPVNVGGTIDYDDASEYFTVQRAGYYWAEYQLQSYEKFTGGATITCWLETTGTCGSGTRYAENSQTTGANIISTITAGGEVLVSDPSTEHPFLCCSLASGGTTYCTSFSYPSNCYVILRWSREI